MATDDGLHLIDRAKLPRHVGIIMDGNGRWARARGLPRSAGHRQGVSSLREIVRVCGDLKIPVLTVFAFSTENWQRPAEEVEFLMELLCQVLEEELDELHRQGVRVVPIGRINELPASVREKVKAAARLTRHNQGLKFNIALNYGGRAEIVEAVRRLLQAYAEQAHAGIDWLIKACSEELLSRYMYTGDDPDPDLIIRTGGEHRLSNFLLWQSAYAELWFTDVMWPDFSRAHFLQALAEYQKRERRFGAVKASEGMGE